MAKHPNVNIPIRVALVLIIIRLGFFFADVKWEPFEMVYLFLIVGTLIPLCLYGIWPRGKNKTFLQDLSAAMRSMAVYGIIIIIFTILFYAFIDTSFFAEKQTEILKRTIEQAPGKDIAKLQENVESFFSLRNFSVLLLMGFMIASIFYALFFTVIKRLFYERMKKKQWTGAQPGA